MENSPQIICGYVDIFTVYVPPVTRCTCRYPYVAGSVTSSSPVLRSAYYITRRRRRSRRRSLCRRLGSFVERSTGGAARRRRPAGDTSHCDAAEPRRHAGGRPACRPDRAGDQRARHALAALQPAPAAAAEGSTDQGRSDGGYIVIYTPLQKNQSTLQIFTSYFVHMWDINMF